MLFEGPLWFKELAAILGILVAITLIGTYFAGYLGFLIAVPITILIIWFLHNRALKIRGKSSGSPTTVSRLLSSDRKRIVRLITIALFSAGMLAAVLFAYQELTAKGGQGPSLISKDEAIGLALKSGEWDKWNEQKATGAREIHATLVHVQPNGRGLKVDESTLQDIPAIPGDFIGYENRYLWVVDIFAPDNSGNKNTVSWIDAKTGEILVQG